MKQLRLILLLIVLNLVAISFLTANLKPGSPEYDAWKQSQIKPPTALAKPALKVSALGSQTTDQRDPCELLVPWDSSFTLAMDTNDDDYTDEILLPFVFPLYGEPQTSCYINNNGNVSFDDPYSSYTPWGFPISGSPMLAPFFADVDTRGMGQVWYKLESNRMIVIWDHVGYYSSSSDPDQANTFELIFSDGTDPTIGLGNTVAFSYADMSWTTGDASGGDLGFGGTPATVGINEGDGVTFDQIGRFDHAGLDYDGAYGENDGVDWLDCKLFLFDTGSTATLTVIPTEDPFPVGPPAGAIPGDPNTQAYYAVYPAQGTLPVQIPVGPGTYRGWIFYDSAWHTADIFPVTGPGTIVFSYVPFDGQSDVPIFITKEDDTLPVELSSFTAVLTTDLLVKIAWTSESETNHAGYNILRSEVSDLSTAMHINDGYIDQGTATGTQMNYLFTDATVDTGNTYNYWLESVSLNGESGYYGPLVVHVNAIGDEPAIPEIPQQTELFSAFPNPFNPFTNLRYGMEAAGNVRIDVFNVKGQILKTFTRSHNQPGYYQVSWDGHDTNGRQLGTGVYFYRMTSGKYSSTKKMIMAK